MSKGGRGMEGGIDGQREGGGMLLSLLSSLWFQV